ncbi:MAG: hypothetical protein DYG89_15075 [Caldilinea sp. CFX5]|nr:hypothetical protein [Caldilinea sp. CFX5]
MNRYTIPFPEALKLAAQRRAERHAHYQALLDEMIADGEAVNINPSQLIILEDAGLDYDFATGFCTERLPLIEAAPQPVGALPNRQQFYLNRQQFYLQVATTLPTVERAELLQEMSREMTATL